MKQNSIRVLGLMFFACLTSLSLAQTNKNIEQNPDNPQLSEYINSVGGPYKDVVLGKEVYGLRTENSKHFLNEDGSYTAIIGAGPMHYLENNVWLTMSENVFENKTGQYSSYEYAVPYNQHKLFFPKKVVAIIGNGNNAQINDSVYTLQRINVVDYSNSYNEMEMNQLKQEAEDEFLQTHIIVNLHDMTMTIADRISDNKKLYSIFIKNNVLHLADCSFCIDSEYKILAFNSHNLILEVESQDEGVNIYFQLIFKVQIL